MVIGRPGGRWRNPRAAALVAVSLLALAGCSDGGNDTEGKTPTGASSKPEGSDKAEAPEDPSTATPLAEVKSGDLSLSVTSAVHDDGGFVTVSGTVTNNGGKFWTASDWMGDERELTKNGASLAGASLVDTKEKKKYLVLRDTSGRCLCTKFADGGVEAGDTQEWYAQFPAPPEGSNEVTFQVGSMPPANVTVSSGE
ncbi:hypothetical protein [Streptomyces sp. MJP52]|uniref:hypothetical protein n=1 Tax=Streptomyces sp. MJP52 TaxID=2940555 RepID=UPI002473512F|nr:hypothetical protein [Streptomyces sp. MJP52]MDH6225290.1 hypothetical protein [Streptomyces sp. MJP52]